MLAAFESRADLRVLVALPGRAKRIMAYTKPSAADSSVSLLSPLEDNNGDGS